MGGANGLFSNDLLATVAYPDPGSARALPGKDVSYTYDKLGETMTKTDQNGTVHTYTYDVLGMLRETGEQQTVEQERTHHTYGCLESRDWRHALGQCGVGQYVHMDMTAYLDWETNISWVFRQASCGTSGSHCYDSVTFTRDGPIRPTA